MKKANNHREQLNMTDLQLSELKANLEAIAQEKLYITKTCSYIYALGSELAIRRLFAKYQTKEMWSAKVTMNKENSMNDYSLRIEL